MTVLSSIVVGQLGTGEQLLLWALRQRRADRGETTPALVQGFVLACGLSAVEPALAPFERLSDALEHPRHCGLCPLRCAVVSADEARCLSLLACAQAGEIQGTSRLAASLVGEDGAAALGAAACQLAEVLGRAGFRLSVPGPHPAVLH
jgi:hypothetical protein